MPGIRTPLVRRLRWCVLRRSWVRKSGVAVFLAGIHFASGVAHAQLCIGRPLPKSGGHAISLSSIVHATSRTVGVSVSRVESVGFGTIRLAETSDWSIAAKVPELEATLGSGLRIVPGLEACASAGAFRWFGPKRILLESQSMSSRGHRFGVAVGAERMAGSRVSLVANVSYESIWTSTAHFRGPFASPRDSTREFQYGLLGAGIGASIDRTLVARFFAEQSRGIPTDVFSPIGRVDFAWSWGLGFSYLIPRLSR